MYLDLLLKRIKLLAFLIFQNETITPIFCSKVLKNGLYFRKAISGTLQNPQKFQVL